MCICGNGGVHSIRHGRQWQLDLLLVLDRRLKHRLNLLVDGDCRAAAAGLRRYDAAPSQVLTHSPLARSPGCRPEDKGLLAPADRQTHGRTEKVSRYYYTFHVNKNRTGDLESV